MKKQIIAMGGSGFFNLKKNELMNRYILKQTGKKHPKICFIPTAIGDKKPRITLFYKAFKRLGAETSVLSLYNAPLGDLEKFVLSHDAIYVSGGNTYNMLTLWKAWGLDKIIRKAWNKGIVLCGPSAGSICWFEQGVTDSWPGPYRTLKCLGFLKGSNCPHYDGEKERRPSYHRLQLAGEMKPGYAADDNCALHFVGTKLHKVVSARPRARAYYVYREGKIMVEKEIIPEYLG